MLLKQLISKQRRISILEACIYRVSLPVREIRVFANGDCYPVCPRCANTIDREYMCFCDRCGQKLGWQLLTRAKTIGSVSK